MTKALCNIITTLSALSIIIGIGVQLLSSPSTARAASIVSTQVSKANIVVQGGQRIGPVSRMIFGQNLERTDSHGRYGIIDPQTRQLRPKAVAVLRSLRPGTLRYPGGSLTTNFNWKKAVGPVAQRGDRYLGLDEFIELCKRVGAQPVITVSIHTGDAADQADLVEYLNSPATPEHPWAMKRKAWGHPEPFDVTYFELGNEVGREYYKTKQYVPLALKIAKAMRAVDPHIKLGIDLTWGGGWKKRVLKGLGQIADFAILHPYAVGYHSDNPDINERWLMQATMASNKFQEQYLVRVHQLIRRYLGHDLPLALTEYNGLFVQDKPRPYRFSVAAALYSADWIRVMLKPDNNVIMGDYWQFVDGYWGMIRHNKDGSLKKMPAYWMYSLWSKHVGDKLLQSQASSPQIKLTSKGQPPAPSLWHAPPPMTYATLTQTATISTDGQTLYLMVFNKTIDQPLTAHIDLQNFHAASARRWTVDAPHNRGGLDTMAGSKAVLTANGVPFAVNVDGTSTVATLTFPAHSMSALEFVRSN